LIIQLIIQTILLDPSGAVWTDDASNVSRLDPSGAVQIDAEHPSRNRLVAGLRPASPAWPGLADRCGRSHNQAWVGCIVWSATARSSTVRVSRSTWSRRRVPKAAMVRAAPVEAPVDRLVDAAAGRLEGGGHGQGGPGHGQAGVAAQQLPEPQDDRSVPAAQQHREQPPGQGAADDAVRS
jgi:hypothetical protein